MEVKDSNGTLLNEGDSVLVIRSLKAKGSSMTIKRAPNSVLKTCFRKKK